MAGSVPAADRAAATEALTSGRQRAAATPPAGQKGLLLLQRRAGNEAVTALLSARLRHPAADAVADIDTGLRELRRDEPAIEPVEKGLRAAQAAGVPVDLEGPRPPASALAVIRTGFGPASVPPKKPTPPAKPVPPKSPLARFAGSKAPTGATGAAAPPATTPRTAGPAAAPAASGSRAAPVAGVVDPQAPPVAPAVVRPEDDAAFGQVTRRVGAVAKEKRAHPPASSKAKEAQDAALPPADDLGTQAKASKVEKMDAQQPGSFDKVAFITAVKAAIEAKSPKTLTEADSYRESGKAGEVKGEVQGLVSQGKTDQAKSIETATEAPPDQSTAVPKPVTPMAAEQPGAAPPVSGAGAAPKPAPADQLNLAAGPRAADAEMAENDITDDQLSRSNEPEFTQAVADKRSAAEHSVQAPAQYRQQESQAIQQTTAEANTEATAGVAGMQGSKASALAKLVADKGKAKTKDEAKRAEVTGRISAIFAATETDVKKILDGIDAKVDAAFGAGEASARQAFEGYVGAKMSAYKKDRYGGWLGGLRWAKDKLLGMPEKVNEFYEAGRELYLKQMDGVISRVADIVGNDLTAAKRRIAAGKAEIVAYVKSLPSDLKKVGAQASQEIGERFADLESEVDAKQESVVDALATKYVEARKGLDERIEALQAENKGLVDKAIGAIKAVINTIRELVSMLKNVLARAAGVVSQIIKDPIGFLGNLIAGIKGGILKFKDNILDHLRKGLMSWLFGSLAEAGIELPDSFDLKGIIKFLASIFGLTWANIRNRIVKQIGEKAMAAVESGVEIFSLFRTQGLGGLWQLLLEKLGDIKEMILNQVKDFVITKIITAGITWLIGLLNPAAAFIKACKLIYDVVMFFVTNGSRIMAFVNTILDSVAEIVRGNVGSVVNKINDVLGQMVPIIIGFLASVIGLGGIGQKIREIVTKLQKPVNAALDFVIKKGLSLAGPIIRGLKGVGARVKAKAAAGKAWVKGKAQAGKAWVKDKAAAGLAKAKARFRREEPRGPQGDLTAAEVRRHERIADSVAERLKRPGHGHAYRDVRQEKEAQARELVREHQPKLKPGIGLRVAFAEVGQDQRDQDVDFEVVIAPNTTRRTGSTPIDNKFYPNGFHPTSRPMDLLWQDASPAHALENERPADVPVRVGLAREELRRRYNAQRHIVSAILAVNDGQAPRAFVSAQAEDALGLQNGHIVARHVLGPHRTRLDLAARILIPGPQQTGRSSAFNSVADANAAIAAWMATTVQGANWSTFRELLIEAGAYQEGLASPGAAAWGLSLRRAPTVQVPIAQVAARPVSLGGATNREAYPGENPALGNPMTVFEACTRVTVRVLADRNAPGGWFVHSAWPAP